MNLHADPANVQKTLIALPDLCIDGFRHYTRRGAYPSTQEEFAKRRAMFLDPEYLSQIATACAYLNLFTIDRKDGSYGLKHTVERWGREAGMQRYVTNGCVILAASMSGYRIVRERNSPNCRFRWE